MHSDVYLIVNRNKNIASKLTEQFFHVAHLVLQENSFVYMEMLSHQYNDGKRVWETICTSDQCNNINGIVT